MFFHDSKTKGVQKDFKDLEAIMSGLGFFRGAWDYTKATYDIKYTVDEVDYYLRLRAVVVNKKQLENPKARLELDIPYFVRHFFPHGMDENSEIPAELTEEVNQKVAELEHALASA
ncbi:YugN family protein [Thermoactinomyces sp. DSM 45892]|uniref:YugN family protein n=1 Tax=Thermoactinomyces sp. DSM 45892 TaxID=1882753 RepID=UPI00089ADF27|nr:YugN family protein [Thermoactinomyces sp. DSM 45892]SDY28259.1 YugN-like family protein [Thermoactinomyces sp. DSM 45892]